MLDESTKFVTPPHDKLKKPVKELNDHAQYILECRILKTYEMNESSSIPS